MLSRVVKVCVHVINTFNRTTTPCFLQIGLVLLSRVWVVLLRYIYGWMLRLTVFGVLNKEFCLQKRDRFILDNVKMTGCFFTDFPSHTVRKSFLNK